MRDAFALAAILACLLLASPAPASPDPRGQCAFGCKIRITACHKARGKHCFFEDKRPERDAGLCPVLMMQIVGEWVAKHPKLSFGGAACVWADDERI